MKAIYLVIGLLAFHHGLSQKFTISGSVKDKHTGENLIGSSIYDLHSQRGTSSNTYGFFSLTLAKDSVHLRVSYVGYEPTLIRFVMTKDTVINVGLTSGTTLGEVVISGTTEDRIQETTRMGTIDVPLSQIKSLPALMGETDVLKVLQLLPGVQGGSEGSSGLYVRGGGPDQNLILLDGVPVYNASHLFGFFSVFNADAINHVELIKGGFPARYGGRLSSVIDISMKEGNNQELKGEGSIGLIASRITVEGPLIKDRTSFIVSARRTYIDILARPLIKASSEGDETAGYYFYDLNTKINHKINEKNRIYLSAYMGDDKAYSKYKGFYINNNERTDYKDEFGLRWGNISTALRWNSIISNKLFSNVTATYSRYRFDIFAESEEKITTPSSTSKYFYKDQYISGIRDYALKADFDFIPNPSHYVKFGAQAINHLFTPGVYSYRGTDDSDTTFGARRIYSQEFAAYIEDDFMISRALKMNFGVHASGFLVEGKFYKSIQPRLAARYLMTPTLSWKASFATMTQYLHLLTNAGLGLPTDLWVPATPTIKPEQSAIASTGFAFNLKNEYELTVEGYYKTMQNLIEYKDGASYLNIQDNWQTKVEVGDGESYGAEFFLHKKTGKVNGWLGYTLSWTNRTFPNLNEGKTFPYKYDRRHDVEIAIAYEPKPNRELALTWVYGTGTAISLPKSTYEGYMDHFDYFNYQNNIQYYEGRNAFRMRAYHRLDFSYTTTKKTKFGERSWTIGVYNLYSRRNPFFMEIGYDRDGNKKFIQYSLFPIIPSIAYRFKF